MYLEPYQIQEGVQMQQVRVPRAPQVPVPPVSATPLELSRETRQQLRVTRHRAFEWHQENAQWTQQLLDGYEAPTDVLVTPSGLATSPEELRKQLETQKNVADALERRVKQQKEAQEAEQRRFEDMLTTLKTAGDVAALEQCEEKLEAEKTQLLTSKPRKMEIVRL
ncbi:hypothetical protein PF005_g23499 [Phytophthora fragariae]|uniref:Uncharacterized protein n=1 Tax=Phytophthora fragariae TaxID=53985 RepID=A0A6A3ICU5_9STRA|nr:hypothetical protein PF009_g8302 [Phytophthora fragariae]KAE8980856.1 hypothetical protein PF011_g22263 [Phytophthora fragariae]KAE9079387.1 hypothetical protein PF007_g23472 [Phytophthora fragariae]KAE9095857.1 hypothetical protein PF010_g16555 [Phytophthora fragariae]KAE9101042.1 hypothetical protein PF006_g22763 [Phytophthora fragariae]